MLASLRLVLNTVSTAFHEDIFLRIPLIGRTANEVREIANANPHPQIIFDFLMAYKNRVRSSKS